MKTARDYVTANGHSCPRADLPRTHISSKLLGINDARVAELADAPDLGSRNHRFRRVAFHFKANAFYEWKRDFSYEIVAVANGE
jgi:hypothetical protein